ncbi:MAG: hypothetical protein FJ241_08865 [Nitrospira sp.]|nr:hypothetical protein [Nitrospira sp.]
MKATATFEKKIVEELKELPEEDYPKILEFVHYLKKGILSEKKKRKGGKKKRDPLLLVDEFAVDTGIPDLAEQHDHYLYGVPKK